VLRIVSWSPIPRIQQDVAFEWKTGTWMRMKLQVLRVREGALVRGKVWPRDQAEPEAWTVEVRDPFPNPEGSPALYGYSAGTTDKSKGTEIYWDNVRVTPNDTGEPKP
jgi:hypothetical protein